MPNWCSNYLRIQGAEEVVYDFVEKFSQNGFEAFVPTPSELLEHESPIKNEKLKEEFLKKYGAPDWYEWRLQNWGTKWSPDPEDIYVTGCCGDMNVLFETAWSPPIEFFDKVAKMYPQLKFNLEYQEPGIGFLGEAQWSHGERDYDDCYEWGERFDAGWHIYKNMIDPSEEIEYLLDLVDDLSEEEKDSVIRYFNRFSSNEERVREILEVISSLDIDEIKQFIKTKIKK